MLSTVNSTLQASVLVQAAVQAAIVTCSAGLTSLPCARKPSIAALYPEGALRIESECKDQQEEKKSVLEKKATERERW